MEEKAREAEDVKAQLAQAVQARAEVAEAHAVLQVSVRALPARRNGCADRLRPSRQAEFAIFKQQANMPKQIEEQIERLCQQQVGAPAGIEG